LFFLLSGIILVIIFIGLGSNTFKVLASFCLFFFFLFFIVLATKEIFSWFSGKVRPVFIYFPMLIAMSVLPLFTWIIAEQVPDQNAYYMGGTKVLSVFSLIFIHPSLSIQSIWEPAGNLGMMALSPGMKVPTFLASLAFFAGLLLFLKIISILVNVRRKSEPVKQIQPE
jgi:hypothetical protein